MYVGILVNMSNDNLTLSQGCLGQPLLFKVNYMSDPGMSVSLIKEVGWKYAKKMTYMLE